MKQLNVLFMQKLCLRWINMIVKSVRNRLIRFPHLLLKPYYKARDSSLRTFHCLFYYIILKSYMSNLVAKNLCASLGTREVPVQKTGNFSRATFTLSTIHVHQLDHGLVYPKPVISVSRSTNGAFRYLK